MEEQYTARCFRKAAPEKCKITETREGCWACHPPGAEFLQPHSQRERREGAPVAPVAPVAV